MSKIRKITLSKNYTSKVFALEDIDKPYLTKDINGQWIYLKSKNQTFNSLAGIFCLYKNGLFKT